MSFRKEENQFYSLSPEEVLSCAESEGFKVSGRFIPLNSYENRVYLIYLDDAEPIVGKFYRPDRWSIEALNEEHLFMRELEAEGVSVVNALKLKNGDSVAQWGSINYCFYPQHKGRMPYELLPADIKKVGRTLARLHSVGAKSDFEHRHFLNGQDYGWADLDLLENYVDPNYWDTYQKLATQIINTYIGKSRQFPFQRVHGDCHRGNLLNNEVDFFFVDFDDSMMAPVAQDLWMILAGDEDDRLTEPFLKAYEELRTFDSDQLSLFPYMQAIRVIHYSAWIAKRWSDPSFPKLFPQFESANYWGEEIVQLEKIMEKI